MALIFLPTFLLIRLDEARAGIYAIIGGLLILALTVWAVSSERLRSRDKIE